MSPEEDKIWRSIQRKDGEAFEHFYKDHYKFFLLAACKYLGDAPLAQEVVNDVFVRLWQDAERIDIQSSLKSYLYRAVVNRCLNELDKHKRDRQHFQELKHRPEETAEWKEMEDNELKIRLYKAIDDLPEQCRKVFRMSRFEELKQQEIADRLGISIKTVKNHITHALQQLNRVLDEWNTLPMLLAMVKYFFGHH
jgi:RNA polymerase sigma-70 factor (ECF subfamily)